jgi:hypothetical protein
MSEPFDRDRVSRLINRLDEIQRESERIRNRIQTERRRGAPWPERRRSSRLFDDIPHIEHEPPSDDSR